MLKNNFENKNFAIFEELVDNFGRTDNDIVKKNAYFQLRHMWFHVQLVQKILNGIQCRLHKNSFKQRLTWEGRKVKTKTNVEWKESYALNSALQLCILFICSNHKSDREREKKDNMQTPFLYLSGTFYRVKQKLV